MKWKWREENANWAYASIIHLCIKMLTFHLYSSVTIFIQFLLSFMNIIIICLFNFHFSQKMISFNYMMMMKIYLYDKITDYFEESFSIFYNFFLFILCVYMLNACDFVVICDFALANRKICKLFNFPWSPRKLMNYACIYEWMNVSSLCYFMLYICNLLSKDNKHT